MVTSIAKNSQLPGQLCIDFIREAAEAMKEREIEALSSEVAHAALIVRHLSLEGRLSVLISGTAHLGTG